MVPAFFIEPVGVQVDPVLALLRPAQDHLVAGLKVAVFHHQQLAVLKHHAGIHAAFLSQQPLPVYLEVFREHGCAVIVFGGHAGLKHRGGLHIGRVLEFRLGKIRRMVYGQLERHGLPPNLMDFIARWRT